MWFLIFASLNQLPSEYLDIIRAESIKYGLDPLLVSAVVYKESKFDKDSCYRGAHGLMQIQIRPMSCERSKGKALFIGLYNPRINIRRGVRLMAEWRRWWKSHHSKAEYHWLLHYNQGFGKCPKGKRHCKTEKRVPVRSGKIGGYAKRVLRIYKKIKRIKRKKVPPTPRLMWEEALSFN